MTDISHPLAGPWLATARHARILMVGTTCATGALPPSREFHQAGAALVSWIIAAAIVVVHLRHAFGRIAQPRRGGRPVTFLLLAALVYVPMLWLPESWGISQVFFIASAAMLFSGVLRSVLVAAPIVGTPLLAFAHGGHDDLWLFTAQFVEVVVALTVLSGCLVAVALLVRAVDQLDRARADLSEQAAGRERLRVSRDLHDLLGQSLSAVSLKGDLAAALLASDSGAARSEIQGIAALARDTLHSMRKVTLGEHTVSLAAEAEGATALLAAAGIRTSIRIDLPDLTPDIDDTLAWAAREGVTNVLRHSDARTCSIVGGRRDGTVFLDIVNDGAYTRTGTGNGLAGLAARAAALSGTMTATQFGDGRFRLRIDIPEETA